VDQGWHSTKTSYELLTITIETGAHYHKMDHNVLNYTSMKLRYPTKIQVRKILAKKNCEFQPKLLRNSFFLSNIFFSNMLPLIVTVSLFWMHRCQFICLSVHSSVHLLICLSVLRFSKYVTSNVQMTFCLSFGLYIILSVCASVCLSVCSTFF
jgi:hypothetical protein